MLNEDKMKLMTGIAMFEKREGKKISPANRYFCGDYISSRLLLAFFSYTFCFGLCVVIWVLYSSEQLLNVMDLEDIGASARIGGAIYAVGLVVYLVIAGIVYARRYEYAKRGMKVYLAKLRRLEKRYERQGHSRELTKEGVRHDGVSRT